MTEWIDILARNTASAWLTAGAFFLAMLGIVVVARFAAGRFLAAYAARTQTKIDDVLLLVVKKTSFLIVVVIAAFLAHKMLTVPDKLSQVLRIGTVAAAFLQLGLWGNAIITFLLDKATHRAGPQDVNLSSRRAMAYFGRLALWLLILTLLLENLGVKLSPLLAGVGIGGIAVALAVQNILGDLFCYVAIILDKPFIAGDFLVVNDLMGTVERIGLKTTRIRSLSGELLIFANHDLVNSRVRNYKTLQERRIVFRFGVTYETPVEKLERIPALVRSVFDSLGNVRLDRVHFAQLGDFSLNYEVVYYVLSGDYTRYMDVQQDLNLILMQKLEQEEIDFAYPTQSLYVRTVSGRNGQTDGIRQPSP